MSKTSSYLDLSPLYGSVLEEQKSVRTFKDGKLLPDCFSEKRILSQPPGVGAILIMFNRFHNHVVEQLAAINEGGKFRPRRDTPEERKRCDEDLFQTGRLITCGLYINIILIDYVRVILNLNRSDSNWQLDPRKEFKDGPELGGGNQVSAEFNLVYRWHSVISKRDEQWTKGVFQRMFPDQDPKEVDEFAFLAKVRELDDQIPENPMDRPYAGLTRMENGKFKDEDVVEILLDSIEDCANSFGARRVPAVLRAVEILGIRQARRWNLATLNEFRKHFHLQPHRDFEDINPDPKVADTLKHLYGHPDQVELYPGLVAESAKEAKAPGSGLAPSYTVSRAVLSDAVALVRGDRFYTLDFHPKKLTNWGYNEVNYDLSIDNGCMFYKLFARAFPNSFPPNSVFTHYPMTIPKAMKTALQDLDKDHLYTFERPRAHEEPKIIFSYAACDKILADKHNFNVTWGKAMTFLLGDAAKDFMLAADGHTNAQSRKMMSEALFVNGWGKELREFFEKTTQKLIDERMYRLGDFNEVDIVRDVGNIVPVRFASELFMLPLKTEKHPHGVLTEREMYLVLAAIFTCIFFDADPGSSFPLRQKSRQATQVLGKLVAATVESVKRFGFLSPLIEFFHPHDSALKSYGLHLIKRLLSTDHDPQNLVWGHMLGTAGGMVPNQGQLFAQTLEYYLTKGKHHLPEIQRIAQNDDDESFALLERYFLEGSRLYGESAVKRRVREATTIEDNGRELHLESGDLLLLNFRAASHDPDAFPDPFEVRLDRPFDRYIHLGAGPHQCLGLPMIRITLTAMFKHVMRLRNLRPAAGLQGKINKVVKPLPGVKPEDDPEEAKRFHAYLTYNWDSFFPFPQSLKVNWDD